jgi:diguanylate cyclase (GGDEF)-like protein
MKSEHVSESGMSGKPWFMEGSMKPQYRILLVADDQFDKEVILRSFEALPEFQLQWVANLSQARAFLAFATPDVIISDWRLTDGTGIELSRETDSLCPFILMTSFDNEELALNSLKTGVSDYLVKSPGVFKDLPNHIGKVLWEWGHSVVRRQAEQALAERAEHYMLDMSGANDVNWDYVMTLGKFLFSARWIDIIGAADGRTVFTSAELRDLLHPEDRDIFFVELQKCLEGANDLLQLEVRIDLAERGFKWMLVRGKELRDSAGSVIGVGGTLTDITERKQYELKINELAYYDGVTGLPNRTFLYKTLSRIVGKDCVECKGAVFFIDIDNFKMINDAFGHSFGDKVLFKLGRMLSNIDIPGKFLYRLGGDEFVIVAEDLCDAEPTQKIAELILDCFNEPLEIEKNRFYLTASIGVTLYPADGRTPEEILKNVDAAMYTSKANGKNTFTFFDKSIRQSIHKKVEMEANLRMAISREEFCLHYQPQVDLESGDICGFEALIRWNSPKYGMIFPLNFIKLAEKTGLIVPIGYWVLRNACKFAAAVGRKHPGIQIWVNLSNIQLMQTDFVKTVKTIIENAGISPQVMGIEITESMLMESFEDSAHKLGELRNYGLNIALDDFGTGYSSLNYLKKLPINKVKIDKSFIDDISGVGIEKEITSMIIQLAHKIGLQVVGEGVETKEQLEFLKQYQCNLVQGYLIHQPIPEERVEEFLGFFSLNRDEKK